MKNKFKIFIKSLALSCLLAVGCTDNTTSIGDTKGIASTEIKVWGNCEMCQETIEGALQTKGVSKASWSAETKMLSVSYDSSLISLDEIHKKVAASGYDTEKYKASEESYQNLHECCQYERKP